MDSHPSVNQYFPFEFSPLVPHYENVHLCYNKNIQTKKLITFSFKKIIMVQNQITLGYFPDSRNFYHVYKINRSSIAESPHNHDFFQICYVIKGTLVHKHQNKSVFLNKGDALIVPPVLTHSMCVEEQNTTFYSLSFQEHLFNPHFCYSFGSKFLQAIKMENLEKKSVDLKLKILLNETQQLIFESLFECLICQSKIEENLEDSIASSLITAILTTLAKAYFSQPNGKEQLAYISACQNIILDCIEYIDSHYNEPISVPHLSKKFAISVSSFGIWFPEVAGTPFKQYLNRKRIEHASALASVNSLNFNEIAHLVGYNNHSTFYRNFIKFKGLSPSDYRNKVINKSN